MKVVFLLDNSEYVELTPEQIQIRQLQPGVAALGTEVQVPVKNEDGTPKLKEDGTPELQVAFRPFINYGVNLSIPAPVTAVPVPVNAEPITVEAKPVPAAGKKASAKRKAN